MKRLALLLSGWSMLVLPSDGHAQPACSKRATAGLPSFYIEVVPPSVKDSLTAARLCISAGAKPVGSYMASISYDSTRMRVARVVAAGGMQAVNSNTPGVIRIAGASANGFPAGALATMEFKPVTGTKLSSLTVSVTEATTVSGASLTKEVLASGYVPREAGAVSEKPTIDSISPRSAEVGGEGLTDLILYGKGFAASNNVVLFDGVEIGGLLSESRGTIVRFIAPTQIPARGGMPAHRIAPGRVQVRVRNTAGTSNAVTFIVKKDS